MRRFSALRSAPSAYASVMGVVMSDPRHVKLAQVLVNHSLGLKRGDKALILT